MILQKKFTDWIWGLLLVFHTFVSEFSCRLSGQMFGNIDWRSRRTEKRGPRETALVFWGRRHWGGGLIRNYDFHLGVHCIKKKKTRAAWERFHTENATVFDQLDEIYIAPRRKNEILRDATKPLKERNPVCQCTHRLPPSRILLGSASEASRNASRSDERERRMYSRPDETAPIDYCTCNCYLLACLAGAKTGGTGVKCEARDTSAVRKRKGKGRSSIISPLCLPFSSLPRMLATFLQNSLSDTLKWFQFSFSFFFAAQNPLSR